MNILGAGSVTINGHNQQWDRIELLEGNLLRVTRFQEWVDANTGLTCRADGIVEYHTPGAWTSIVPDMEKSGTLVVTRTPYVDNRTRPSLAPEIIATNLTAAQAVTRAAEYLTERYDCDEDRARKRVEAFFTEDPGSWLRLRGNSKIGEGEIPKFSWVTPPAEPPSSLQSAFPGR